MKKSKHAIFILTHGRANKVYTVSLLNRCGYTGDYYLVVDSDDKQLDTYKSLYKDKVLVFDKAEYIGKFDRMDNFNKRNVVVYARNAVYDLARKVGVKYLIVMDDDYNSFEYRLDAKYNYSWANIKNFDKVVSTFINYLKNSNIDCICFSQGGDFIGGKHNIRMAEKKIVIRKIMNLFFLDVDNPIEFRGTINEDLTTSVAESSIGRVLLTTPLVSLNQSQTQETEGGLTDIYLDLGTYVKSFYSVMAAPSAVKIAVMGDTNKRLHHKVTWKRCSPKIMREGTTKPL